MYKGITPTIILTLPESSAVLSASHVYVTIADKCKSITKQDDELTIEADTEHEAINISVFLTQSETLAFHKGSVMIQVNWTYMESGTAKRACSTIGKLTFADNLLNGVIE